MTPPNDSEPRASATSSGEGTTPAPTEPRGTRPDPNGPVPTPPPPAPALADYILQHGIDAEFIAPGVPMPTVPLAAAALGVPEEQILKSLLFQDRPTGRLLLAIASGTARIDRARLATAAGLTEIRLADPAAVVTATGYPAGGVPPIGHATTLPVVLDRQAAALPIAYAGGGAEHFLLRIRPADILRLTHAAVADITIPDS